MHMHRDYYSLTITEKKEWKAIDSGPPTKGKMFHTATVCKDSMLVIGGVNSAR
jgi:hypothetical protein